jgi:hypothetical protein
MFRFGMMPGRTGGARFFDCVSRVLQPFPNGPFSGLCAMFNRLARFFRGLFNGLPSFLYWTLILPLRCQRYANR